MVTSRHLILIYHIMTVCYAHSPSVLTKILHCIFSKWGMYLYSYWFLWWYFSANSRRTLNLSTLCEGRSPLDKSLMFLRSHPCINFSCRMYFDGLLWLFSRNDISESYCRSQRSSWDITSFFSSFSIQKSHKQRQRYKKSDLNANN